MSKRNSGNNPEEKTDLRIRRTKKSIRDAFFELIDENGFDSVTVKDITERYKYTVDISGTSYKIVGLSKA